MSTGYKTIEPTALYYITLQVIDWIDIFTRREYKELTVGNLAYCQQNKALAIYGYVKMSIHIYLLVQSETENPKTSFDKVFCSHKNKERRITNYCR